MIEKFKLLPWYLIAFIGICAKACIFSIGLAEALVILGLIAFEAFRVYLNHISDKKITDETLEKLQTLESKLSMMTAYKR